MTTSGFSMSAQECKYPAHDCAYAHVILGSALPPHA